MYTLDPFSFRISFASYPNKAVFVGKAFKGREVCKLVRKLLKICHGWLDPHSQGMYGFYGDDLKLKQPVLMREFPRLCNSLKVSLGGNATHPVAQPDCDKMVADLSREAVDDLYEYAKRNLLWLNVYIKDSFATRIVRDERMTITSFVANVGGLLGLCMGFSLVSVAEMIYFCIKQKLFGCWNMIVKRCLARSRRWPQPNGQTPPPPPLTPGVSLKDNGGNRLSYEDFGSF